VCDLAERYQAKVVNMEAPAGQGYSLEELTQAVEQHKPAMLFVVQGESSTGVQQSLAGAGLGWHARSVEPKACWVQGRWRCFAAIGRNDAPMQAAPAVVSRANVAYDANRSSNDRGMPQPCHVYARRHTGTSGNLR